MGHIKIDELSNSLKEYINNLGLTEEQVNNLIKQFSGDKSQLQTNAKGSLVDAINELFQNANNGKELIANAIGEPLTAEDTFSAMSTGINSLLSTFKTNMMNNGVSVAGSDKFKQLIDKISTLADNEGKGIQYAEGTHRDFTEYLTTSGTSVPVSCDLNFTPTLIFVMFDSISNTAGTTISNVIISNKAVGRFYMNYTLSTMISNMTSNGFSMVFTYGDNSNITFNGVTWYAIGVGEEDTTLRDSLASILQEEGVVVTPEDDMASLIAKVDSEFDRQVVPAGDAVAANVLTGKTFINSSGQIQTGTMNNNGTKTITPKASTQTLGAGYYDKITINGDADLVAANIVSGKNIFGVNGSAVKGKTVTASDAIIYTFGPSSMRTYGSGIDFKSVDKNTWLSVGSALSPGNGTIKANVKFATNNSSYPQTVLFVQTRNGSEIARSDEYSTSTAWSTIADYNKFPVYTYTFTVQNGDKIELFCKCSKDGTNSNNSITIFYFSITGTLS